MRVPAYGEDVATDCDYPITTDKTKRRLSITSLLVNHEHGATTKIYKKILASQRGQPYKALCSFAMAVNADMAFLELIRDLLSDEGYETILSGSPRPRKSRVIGAVLLPCGTADAE